MTHLNNNLKWLVFFQLVMPQRFTIRLLTKSSVVTQKKKIPGTFTGETDFEFLIFETFF